MNKSDLIESIAPRGGGGNHKVDSTEVLERNFEKSESVAYMFCSGCGLLFELSKDGTMDLLERMGKEKEALSEQEYFDINGCRECGGFGPVCTIEKVIVH